MDVRVTATGVKETYYRSIGYKSREITKVVDFITIENDNGKFYYVDGVSVKKEEGNAKFLELKKFGTKAFKVEPITMEMAKASVESLEKSYDHYTMYIDDYKQMKEAEENNHRIANMQSAFKMWIDAHSPIELLDCPDSKADFTAPVSEEPEVKAEEPEVKAEEPEVKVAKKTKKAQENEMISGIKERMATDDSFLIDSLLLIYNNQTADEKRIQETKEYNGVGFNGTDANILSSFAEFYKNRNFLSDKQLGIARKKMPKYARQVSMFI